MKVKVSRVSVRSKLMILKDRINQTHSLRI
jgi:hypothetical protein